MSPPTIFPGQDTPRMLMRDKSAPRIETGKISLNEAVKTIDFLILVRSLGTYDALS